LTEHTAPADHGGDGRDESPDERADRNWNELLQELRVTQTGVQLLTAFLVTLPFQSRFSDLDDFQVAVFVVTLLLAALATSLLVAPVSLHRALFGRRQKGRLVRTAHLLAQAGLLALGLCVTGALLLVFSVVLGRETAFELAGAALAVLVALWLVLPMVLRRRSPVGD
jgi:hypothetical protein